MEAGVDSVRYVCPLLAGMLKQGLDGSRSVPSFFYRGLANPAAEELADFGDHAADMLILTVGEPVPTMSQPEIEAQLVESGIGLGQFVAALRAAAALGVKKMLRQIQRSDEKAGGYGLPEGAGKGFAFGDEPLQ